MKKKILVAGSAVAAASTVRADLTLPDLGVSAGDVISSGVTAGGSTIGAALAFGVGITVIFFAYKMLKRVLKPA